MGFIGWRFFADPTTPEAIAAQREYDDEKRAAERRAEKERRKRQEARRLERKRIQDEQYAQTCAYQEHVNRMYGGTAADKTDTEGTSDLFKKFSAENYKSQQEEAARRYGYSYNGYTDGEAPRLSRGMGPAHHQSIKRPKVAHPHSPLGPMTKRIRISIGWQPNGGEGPAAKIAAADPLHGTLSGKLSRPY